MKNKTIADLANRLNEIMKEKNRLKLLISDLDKEYNSIVYELWERIPSLKDDVNIQPKKRTK